MLSLISLIIVLCAGMLIGVFLIALKNRPLYNTFELRGGMGRGDLKATILINGNCVAHQQEIIIADISGLQIASLMLGSGIAIKQLGRT